MTIIYLEMRELKNKSKGMREWENERMRERKRQWKKWNINRIQEFLTTKFKIHR